MSPNEQFDRLARFEPGPFPVVSLYLNTQPDQHGRDHYGTFVRKEFKARRDTYPAGSPEAESLDRDLDRIAHYLDTELQPSANGVALFACSGGDLFEAVQLAMPIEHHWLSIGPEPHLYPLARVDSRYPRYAAVLADTNGTRILVFARGEKVDSTDVSGTKTRRTSQGGWSQARYQRHIENFHQQHIKDVVEALDRIVRDDGIEHIIVAGDEVVRSMVREQLPKALAALVVDEVALPADAPDDEVVKASLASFESYNQRTDREKVDAVVDAFRAGGLGVVGPADTMLALTNGQVDELLITATLRDLQPLEHGKAARMAMASDAALAEGPMNAVAAGEPAEADAGVVRLADELVTKARQTAARITFVEDPGLLAPYGGAAGSLRYRIG